MAVSLLGREGEGGDQHCAPRGSTGEGKAPESEERPEGPTLGLELL